MLPSCQWSLDYRQVSPQHQPQHQRHQKQFIKSHVNQVYETGVSQSVTRESLEGIDKDETPSTQKGNDQSYRQIKHYRPRGISY